MLKRAGSPASPRPAQGAGQPLRVALPRDCCTWTTSRYARFLRPGHRVTGDRSQRSTRLDAPETRVGYDFAHAIVDDHSRLAYAELLDDETSSDRERLRRASARLLRTSTASVAKRLMTDNGFSYVKNRSLRELLARRGIRHLHHPAVPAAHERQGRGFHQTMAREWAYGLGYRSHRHAPQHCHTGSTTTTREDRTARSATGHRSAAFTTSAGLRAASVTRADEQAAAASQLARSPPSSAP